MDGKSIETEDCAKRRLGTLKIESEEMRIEMKNIPTMLSELVKWVSVRDVRIFVFEFHAHFEGSLFFFLGFFFEGISV